MNTTSDFDVCYAVITDRFESLPITAATGTTLREMFDAASDAGFWLYDLIDPTELMERCLTGLRSTFEAMTKLDSDSDGSTNHVHGVLYEIGQIKQLMSPRDADARALYDLETEIRTYRTGFYARFDQAT